MYQSGFIDEGEKYILLPTNLTFICNMRTKQSEERSNMVLINSTSNLTAIQTNWYCQIKGSFYPVTSHHLLNAAKMNSQSDHQNDLFIYFDR